VPWYIHAEGAAGLLLAGIWSHWADPSGANAFDSFAVVTTAAHPSLGFVHHRQPVMLAPAEVPRWLAADASRTMLAPLLEPTLPVALVVDPVSTRVNNARYKESDCATPIGSAVKLSATGDRTC
jgi:putative SOS response-associated peptidase YedK